MMRSGGRGRKLAQIVLPGALVFGLFFVLLFMRAEATTASDSGRPRQRINSGPLLLIAIHPRCACSRASLVELARVWRRAGKIARAEMLLYRPGNQSREWSNGVLRESAEALPGLKIVDDPDGALASAYGLRTSGHVLMYGAGGELRFSGGITAGRGHVGGNAAAARLVSALAERARGVENYRVFGCSLLGLGGT